MSSYLISPVNWHKLITWFFQGRIFSELVRRGGLDYTWPATWKMPAQCRHVVIPNRE